MNVIYFNFAALLTENIGQTVVYVIIAVAVVAFLGGSSYLLYFCHVTRVSPPGCITPVPCSAAAEVHPLYRRELIGYSPTDTTSACRLARAPPGKHRLPISCGSDHFWAAASPPAYNDTDDLLRRSLMPLPPLPPPTTTTTTRTGVSFDPPNYDDVQHLPVLASFIVIIIVKIGSCDSINNSCYRRQIRMTTGLPLTMMS